MDSLRIIGADDTTMNIIIAVFILAIAISLIVGGSVYFQNNKDQPYNTGQIVALISIGLGIIIIVGMILFYNFFHRG